jgi:hypothetical protein
MDITIEKIKNYTPEQTYDIISFLGKKIEMLADDKQYLARHVVELLNILDDIHDEYGTNNNEK